jgi:predicted methyltransferase
MRESQMIHLCPSQRCATATLLFMLLSGCVSLHLDHSPEPLTATRIAEIVGSPDRSAADRTNDLRRKPEQMLAFIGIVPGMIALDVSAGGGYTTELLARATGPTGVVYGQRPPPRDLSLPAAASPEGDSRPRPATATASPSPQGTAPRDPAAPITSRNARLRSSSVPAAPMIPVIQPFENPVPAAVSNARLDVVTFMFNYHDMGHLGVDRAAMNRTIFQALKPGGMYVIADHAGRPGTGISESGTLHRIEEAFLRKEVEGVGFRLIEEGTFLRNPNDPRNLNTPEPPQPKDEFVLKFAKP